VPQFLARLAGAEHDPDRLRQHAAGDESQRQLPGLVEPLRVVDDAAESPAVRISPRATPAESGSPRCLRPLVQRRAAACSAACRSYITQFSGSLRRPSATTQSLYGYYAVTV
jgi:hypothetical protein